MAQGFSPGDGSIPPHWRKYCIYFTLFATLLFLLLVHGAMFTYKGGTIHQHHLAGYSFNYNFFSDLGRNRTPGGADNFPTNALFKLAMTLTGFSIMLFFSVLPGIFMDEVARASASLASYAGLVAGASYIGIGWVPYDVSYGGHHLFVRCGFVAFLAMSFLLGLAIFLEKAYPKRYGWAMLVFALLLFSQLLLMLLGERSWRSNDALFRQATAQKVVVYAEVACMLYQAIGALGYLKKTQATKG